MSTHQTTIQRVAELTSSNEKSKELLELLRREYDAALERVAYVEEQDQKLVAKFHEAVDRTNAAEARVKELEAKLAAAEADANKATVMMVTMAGERDALKAKLAEALRRCVEQGAKCIAERDAALARVKVLEEALKRLVEANEPDWDAAYEAAGNVLRNVLEK